MLPVAVLISRWEEGTVFSATKYENTCRISTMTCLINLCLQGDQSRSESPDSDNEEDERSMEESSITDSEISDTSKVYFSVMPF